MYDKNLVLSDAQSIAQVAGSYLSSNSYDTWQGGTAGAGTPPIGGPLLNDVGRDHLPLFVQITEAVSTGSSPTVDFQLVQADDKDLSVNLATVDTTGAVAAAALVVGYQPALPPVIPPGRVTQRWIGTRYVVAVATTTTGKVSAGLQWDRETNVNVI